MHSPDTPDAAATPPRLAAGMGSGFVSRSDDVPDPVPTAGANGIHARLAVSGWRFVRCVTRHARLSTRCSLLTLSYLPIPQSLLPNSYSLLPNSYSLLPNSSRPCPRVTALRSKARRRRQSPPPGQTTRSSRPRPRRSPTSPQASGSAPTRNDPRASGRSRSNAPRCGVRE